MTSPKTKRVATAATAVALAAGGVLVAGVAWYASAGQGGVAASAAASVSEAGNGGDVVLAETDARPRVEVWKSPTCGCCTGWVTYLEDEGFEVVAHDVDDVDAVKAELGLVDPRLKSCHTATIDGYVVEGHVPVSDIDRLLAERPELVGISAPGMPAMSPGMGSTEPKDYDVIGFAADGATSVFASH